MTTNLFFLNIFDINKPEENDQIANWSVDKYFATIRNNKVLGNNPSESDVMMSIALNIKRIVEEKRKDLVSFTLVNGRSLASLVETANPTTTRGESLTKEIQNSLQEFVKALKSPNDETLIQKELVRLKEIFFAQSKDKFLEELIRLYPNS